MGANRAELRAALIDKLGLLEIDHMIPTESLNRSINNGIARMASEFDWPWLEDIVTIPLTVGDNAYLLPDGFTRIKVASLAGDELTARTLRGLVSGYAEKGRPNTFAVVGQSIRLSPSPNSAADDLVIVYSSVDTYLTDDTTQVRTPRQYTDVIVTYAALDQAVRLKDNVLLNSLEQLRQQWIRVIQDQVIQTTKAPAIQTRDDV